MRIKTLTARLAPTVGLCLPLPAAAQALAVVPTIIEVPAAKSTAALEVRNRSDRPVAVQMRLYAWSQVDGEDVLKEVPGLAISPPIATIPASAAQTFRILLPRGARAAEQSYRVILDQLPDSHTQSSGGMTIRLRMSMPVFAAGSARDKAKLDWQMEQDRLIATNAGSKRIRFTSLSIRDTRKPPSLSLGTSPYLLPGASRAWSLGSVGGSLHLTGESDAGTIDAIVAAP